jgi:hypothetical protein
MYQRWGRRRPLTDLGAFLTQEMHRHGLSEAAVSEGAAIAPSRLRYVMTNPATFSEEACRRLADRFDVSYVTVALLGGRLDHHAIEPPYR